MSEKPNATKSKKPAVTNDLNHKLLSIIAELDTQDQTHQTEVALFTSSQKAVSNKTSKTKAGKIAFDATESSSKKATHEAITKWNEEFLIELSQDHLSELRREAEYYGLGDLMFPFEPAEDETVNSDILNQNVGSNTSTVISQTKSGMWQFRNKYTEKKTVDAVVCRKCSGAYFFIDRRKFACNYHHVYHPTGHSSDIMVVGGGFNQFLNGKRTVDDPNQPAPPAGNCPSCRQ